MFDISVVAAPLDELIDVVVDAAFGVALDAVFGMIVGAVFGVAVDAVFDAVLDALFETRPISSAPRLFETLAFALDSTRARPTSSPPPSDMVGVDGDTNIVDDSRYSTSIGARGTAISICRRWPMWNTADAPNSAAWIPTAMVSASRTLSLRPQR